MSVIRIFGLFLSLLIFLFLIVRLRKYKSKIKVDPLMLFVLGGSLFIISIYPAILNRPTDFFLSDNLQGARIILLLIF